MIYPWGLLPIVALIKGEDPCQKGVTITNFRYKKHVKRVEQISEALKGLGNL